MNRGALKGPKGSFVVGNLPEFGRDPLGFLERCARDFGDFVPLRFLGRPVLFINAPAAIEQVLVSQARNFRKTIGYRTPFMRRLFGQGLLTSEGEFWTRQRRLSQPAFHRDRIATYAGTIVEFTEQMLAAWRPGETRNIHEEMMRLTTRVVSSGDSHTFQLSGPSGNRSNGRRLCRGDAALRHTVERLPIATEFAPHSRVAPV